MEHDSSRSGYHEPEPGLAGLEDEEDWGDDFPKTFSVNLIWAQACDKEGHDGAIGFEGGMPWHLPEDMRRFKELTVSHPVIMGRKTWESLSPKYRPLPNRDNIVVSRDPAYTAPGAPWSTVWMMRLIWHDRKPFRMTVLTAAKSGLSVAASCSVRPCHLRTRRM